MAGFCMLQRNGRNVLIQPLRKLLIPGGAGGGVRQQQRRHPGRMPHRPDSSAETFSMVQVSIRSE